MAKNRRIKCKRELNYANASRVSVASGILNNDPDISGKWTKERGVKDLKARNPNRLVNLRVYNGVIRVVYIRPRYPHQIKSPTDTATRVSYVSTRVFMVASDNYHNAVSTQCSITMARQRTIQRLPFQKRCCIFRYSLILVIHVITKPLSDN